MLVELRIRDLAIIDEVDMGFSRGLNVLTGETGAGKSIIINAVNMLLGDRAAGGSTRTGAEQGTVEALFDCSDCPEIQEKLKAVGLADTKEVLVKRIVTPLGRSRAFVNGELSALSHLSRIGDILVSVYGQHEHQTLQKPEKHIDVLDEYGRLLPLRRRYEEAFREMDGIHRKLAGLKERENQAIRDRELMMFQSQEIGSAKLQQGEEESLKEQRTLLLNAERLFEWADLTERELYSDGSSVSEKLAASLQRMREISRIDPSMETLAGAIESSIYQVEEVASSLRDYKQRIEYDPEAFETVEHRLDEIRRLKMKYGQTIEEILQFKDRIDQRLRTLDSERAEIERWEERLREVETRVVQLAQALSSERKKAAVVLQEVIEEELASLGMENTVFQVCFGLDKAVAREKWTEVGGVALGPRGMDTAEFYISPNVGEEPRPLSRIASGGELSRIMLALRRIIASAEPGQTLIFDEVDAGIGGAVAEVVGKKLKDLSQYHQVLCVTHLPQIASFADAHHRVTKRAEENRTLTQTKELNEDERVDEIARMLGGLEITEKTRAHALEMIERARKENRGSAGGPVSAHPDESTV